MKEITESTWSFQIILIFILLFAAFLSLVLQYSKAFSIKNRILTVMEKYEGATSESIAISNNYVFQKSYKTTASCPENDGTSVWYGVSADGSYGTADANSEYLYCFREIRAQRNSSNEKQYVYYEVQVFYRFGLPFLGGFGLYRIKGETKKFIGNDNRITSYY